MSIVVDNYKLLIKRCLAQRVSLQDAEDIVQNLALRECLLGSEIVGIGYFMNAAKSSALLCHRKNYTQNRNKAYRVYRFFKLENYDQPTTNDSIEKERQILRLNIALDTLKPIQKKIALAETHNDNESIKAHYKRAIQSLKEQKDSI